MTALCSCGCGDPAPIAQRDDKRRGNVKGQPMMYRQGHSGTGKPPRMKVEDRGYDTPCWIWQWNKSVDG